MPYVRIKKGSYVVYWNGIPYELIEGSEVLLPDEVIKALFPQRIEDYFPAGATISELDIRNLLNTFVSRWSQGIRITSKGELPIDNLTYENFLEFIDECFEVISETETVTEEAGIRRKRKTKIAEEAK